MSGPHLVGAEGGARVIPFPAPPPLQRARGAVRIAFKRRGDQTGVAELYQSGCAKIRLLRPEKEVWPEAVLINTAGGLTDGDCLTSTAEWGPATSATVTTQAAERIYRSRLGAARIETRLTIGAGATALWLPQETILFDRADLSRSSEAELDAAARLIACESVIFGRGAMGEAVRAGAVQDAWRVRVDGRLVLADVFRLSGDMAAALDRPALGAGARALATVLYVGPGAAAHLAARRAREPGPGPTWVASSCRDDLVVTRILAPDSLSLRRALRGVLEASLACLEAPVGLPKVWAF